LSNRTIMADQILLQTGLEVSAKFKGAFCEARIKSVDANLKCKVRFSDGKTIETSHKNLTGSIALQAKVSFHGKVGHITRVKDVSVYTVVFDDGDEKTLKRGSLCIKGQRHFDESVTLDSLPLTDPEHFGNNVQAKDMPFNSAIFTTDDTTTDIDDETDQSGSSVELKKSPQPPSNATKTPSSPPKAPVTPPPPKNTIAVVVPPPPPSPEKKTPTQQTSPVEPPPTPEKTKQEIIDELQKEYTLNQAELNDADGPDERINMIGIHMIFLSNAYQQFKTELVQIERIRKKRKLRQEKADVGTSSASASASSSSLSAAKEMKTC